MSDQPRALTVLARALYDHADKADTWDSLPADLQQSWCDRAEVVLGQMGAVTEAQVEDPSLTEAIELTEAVAQRVSEAAANKGVTSLPWQAATKLLDRLREATWLLGTVDAALVTHIYLTGEHGKQLIDGLGQVMIARSRDRKQWDGRGVARAVIDYHMEERGGETPDDPWDVAEWLLEVIAADRCRVTPLRAMGIPPEHFCEDLPGKVAVSLPPKR